MLTAEQLPTLRTAIDAETAPEFVALRTEGATGAMAEWFNAASSFVVWKSNVSEAEILRNGMDWTRVDNLSVGPARIWEWMFKFGSINPSKPNIRAGIDAVWKGTAADLAVRASVYTHCKRPATRGEKLFSTGTGTEQTPGDLGFEGAINDQDVIRALRL
jgi:hypothetical protein